VLSFDPPYAVIGGYTLLPDHEDRKRWYAIPPAPQLALGDGGRPELSVLEYLGGGAAAARLAGAAVSFTTMLTIPDDVLAMLAAKMRERLGPGAPAALTVSGVMFDAGTVELIVLGSSSARPPAAPAPPPGPFDIAFAGSGLPSLGGDNRASFQLLVDPGAAQLLSACLDAPDLPVLVVYRMQLSGLRPEFSVHVDADWSRVYHDLEQQARLNVYYVAADVQAMISQTLEQDGVRIDETIFGPGADAAARADRAQKFLADWVASRLFVPFVDPAAATANAIGQVVDDTVFSLTRSVLPGLGYKLRYVSDDELRTMSARMDETVAEQREIVPQGTLGGLLNSLRVDERGQVRPTWTDLRTSLVKQVNLADFPRLEVQVGVEDRFTADGIEQVTVDLARAGDDGTAADEQSLAFRDATGRRPYLVNLLGRADPSLSQPYRWRAEVQFDPAGPFGPHPPARTQWRDGVTSELVVEPREAYLVRTVTVETAPTFSWSQFPAVDVDLRYRDPTDPQGTVQHGRLGLSPDRPRDTWRFRAVVADTPAYSYQVTYERPGDQGGPIAVPEHQQADDILTVPDPLPRKRRLDIFTSLPWEKISTAFVELEYRDDAHGIHSDEQLDLLPGTTFLRRDIPIAADGPTAVSYRLTVLFTGGKLLAGSWRSTEDDRLVIDRTLVDSRTVTVRVVSGPLASRHLAEVHVRLEADDPVTGAVRDKTELVIDAGNEASPLPPWEYLAGDPPVQGPRYQAVFIDDHGFATTTPWAVSPRDLLVVSLANRTISG
jgi:hypothetical protein